MCDYMNNCNQHGSCGETTGQCTCEAGWYGADCSVEMNWMMSTNFTTDGTEWNYFLMPANETSFTIQLESSHPFDLYILKGTEQVPDPANFDVLFKQEQRVIMNNFSFDVKDGFILAIYTYHSSMAEYQLQVAMEHFVMLNAMAKPAPAPPGYRLPEQDPIDSQSDNFNMSDIQFMLLGAVFGILSTLLYWRCARI